MFTRIFLFSTIISLTTAQSEEYSFLRNRNRKLQRYGDGKTPDGVKVTCANMKDLCLTPVAQCRMDVCKIHECPTGLQCVRNECTHCDYFCCPDEELVGELEALQEEIAESNVLSQLAETANSINALTQEIMVNNGDTSPLTRKPKPDDYVHSKPKKPSFVLTCENRDHTCPAGIPVTRCMAPGPCGDMDCGDGTCYENYCGGCHAICC